MGGGAYGRCGMKYIGNFFSLPNEIFLLGLSPGELAVYCYLRRCENQKTHQCWPSYKTIGEAVGMCENTVSRYVKKLEERRLIAVEPTKVTTKAGVTRNGTLQFTLLPPQNVIARHYEEKLAELELTTERQRVQELLKQQTQNTPCAPV
ncbi:helix-turn-helix domain-containing protein [Pseudoflavonifractor sp. NSJ-25]|uniref:Helix-turn-helix domain-containing protein n=2 Tax=Pseudoflavonifractor hominis TaxID=2763059 RepID=A0ABR7HSC3_9FIRM|nr:helix-turn-helix domain-containing protein [Pseudoflavonifractor hominis]